MDAARNYQKGEIKKGTDPIYPNKIGDILSIIFVLKEGDG